jgi:hypothetical protein
VVVGIPADHLVQAPTGTHAPAVLDVFGLLYELLCGTWDVANEETLGTADIPAVTWNAVLAEREPALLPIHGRRSQI